MHHDWQILRESELRLLSSGKCDSFTVLQMNLYVFFSWFVVPAHDHVQLIPEQLQGNSSTSALSSVQTDRSRSGSWLVNSALHLNYNTINSILIDMTQNTATLYISLHSSCRDQPLNLFLTFCTASLLLEDRCQLMNLPNKCKKIKQICVISLLVSIVQFN